MNFLFQFFYNLAFTIGFLFASPYFFYRMLKRGSWRPFLGERFGCYSKAVEQKLLLLEKPLWIHAVSVGEMMLARVLIEEIRKLRPQQAVVITTTTVTGRRVGSTLIDDQTLLLYAPIDFIWVIKRAYSAIRPLGLVLVEGEVWPNYLWEAARRKVPVYLVNGRLSDRSLPRYQTFSFFTKPLLDRFSWVALQHESDRLRFVRAGYPPYKLFVVGSMKFDVAGDLQYDKDLAPKLIELLGWHQGDGLHWNIGDAVLLAGSTHKGEEALLIKIFKKLREQHQRLRLVLVPRHNERAKEVLKECQGFSVVLRSQLDKPCSSPPDVMIVNTTGELKSLYPMGTINFIGKSFIGYGGQNFIEAVRFGKPVIFGPHMENFSSLVALFLEKEGVIQVEDSEALYPTILNLLKNPQKREEIGERAKAVFEENVGAAERTARMIMAEVGR